MGIDDWHVVSRKKHGYRSYEDDVAKISISIYVSNLPETFSAKDLFHACNKYGHVVDSFIPLKRSKEGKRFGFVKFINVSNVERLVGNLCTVWVGRYKLQANKARFGRPPLNGRNIRNSKSDDRHLGGFKEPNVRPTNGNKETRNNSFASVLKSNQPNNLSSSNMIHDSSPAIALDDDCLSANDLSCVAIGKIKDINALSNLSVILNDEGFDDIKISYLGGYWVLIQSKSCASKEKLINHAGVLNWFHELGNANNSFVSDIRLVWIAIEGLPMCAWNNKALSKIVSPWGTLTPVDLVEDSSLPYRKVCVTTKVSTIINDRTKIIVKGKVYWIRIRELEPWSPELDDEFCESSSDDESVGEEKNNSITGDANDHVSESSFMNENIENVINEQEPPQDKISEDPFGIYNILNKQDNKEAGQDSDPSHPPGFTQEVNVGVSVNQPVHSDISPNIGGSQNVSGVNRSFCLKTGGSIMDVIENLVEVGQTMGYNMAGCKKNLEDIVASHGDSMLESINLFSIKDLWGNSFFDFSFSSSVGLSGGILCVWDPNSFAKDNATISDYFVAVRGTWLSTATKYRVILNDEGFDDIKISYLGGYWVLIQSKSCASKEKLINHAGVLNWFHELGNANNSFVSDIRLVWIAIEGLPMCAWNNKALSKIVSPWGTLTPVDLVEDSSLPYRKVCVTTKVSTIINDRTKIIVKGKVYWIRIRELEPWSPELDDEFCESSSDDEFVGDEKNNSITGDANDHVSESSFMNENIENVINEQEPPQDKISEDPFGIYNILNKQDNKEAGQDSDPSHPPGFTQEVNVGVSVNLPVHSDISPNIGGSQNVSGVNRSFSLKTGGSIMDVIENLVEVGQTMGYNMAGCKKNLEDIVASHGDSMLESINLFSIKDLWGNSFFDFSFSSSVGLSGGILCVWDPNSFVKDNATISDYFVAVRGTWLSTATKVMFVSIYAPQDISEKKSLWEYITHIIDTWDGECIILGDFNEVRSKQERFGTIFNETAANAFNHFISTAGLIDLPLEGYSFTWAIKSAKKMSKLDRFLISEGLLLKFPSLSAICLDRHLSDHRPIIMREVVTDYGPSPFRVYQSWFHKKGFDKLIKDSWSYSSSNDSNKIILLKKKLQALKASIKEWCKDDIKRSNDTCFSIKARLSDLDKLFDNGLSNEELVTERISLLKELHNFNKSHSLDLAQKAKVRWAIEGDENSKYFHGIINKKRSQLAIRGVLIDGDWIDEPCKVKNEFLMHFANRFESPSGPCIDIDCHLFKKLSSEQVDDLECDVTFDEIKKAVWDCGTNKSPGPDGFSFDFIRTFWDILKHDFVNAIREFFISSKFPPGCNSSFIALIPKKHDAKFVKDYRPISLIGCFYKIVSKILANRLKMVISELISDVQSAFVSNRQILDGPFILNELISWCKAHKSKAMIFKVDFEKAFDSVRWDFLDIILRNFGFGIKWRGWIQGCLSSAMGSILVNGSPTAEFKFHKGLKQGDPLSPYLFILVMESLLLSFNNIINADLFKGIRFDDSLTLSHLFYADDAVFIGKWDRANILTIVRMLKCFFLASGLQINILKSKLMGIGVSNEEVLAAANIIGCSTFSTPFSYLGVKVGMSPSRRKAWDEIIGKVSNRLSKWKIKTLSVGGRLTLIKSVLTSLPLYHMSLYKAPLGVLRDLESLRRKFFNGADINEKRFSMISWNKILASKQKGGLGVSSFFALNRSLLFKWVWRFLSQDASLWHRLIAVLYGNRSPFVHTGSVSSLSPWNCILKELNSLSAKGINLLALLKKKVGNGANTLFWEDCWINDVPLSRSFPRLYALELKKGITVADKLIDASFVASFRRNPRGGVEEEQLHHLVELVGSISLSPSNDRWAWLLGSSGEFSVHSARTFIDDILLPFVGDVTRWVKVVPIKVNILAWKVCLDKLPTRLNLSLRGIDIPSIICPNCGLAGESCSHLFYSCNLARTLWRKIARWWEIDIPDFSCYEEWIAWFKTTRFSKAQKEMLEGVFYVMWWMIWKFRNQVLFGSSHPRMELLFDDIVSYSFTWCSNRCKNNIDWISWMKCPKSISL
ncbi:RNA-directed DNA polymerase, eukaryota [Tanacetum coccineum]